MHILYDKLRKNKMASSVGTRTHTHTHTHTRREYNLLHTHGHLSYNHNSRSWYQNYTPKASVWAARLSHSRTFPSLHPPCNTILTDRRSAATYRQHAGAVAKRSFVFFFLGASLAFEFYMPTFRNTLFVPSSQAVPTYKDGTDTYLPMKTGQCVPKRWHIKFRRRSMTHKEAYNIQNTAKVWNQEKINFFVIATTHSSTKHCELSVQLLCLPTMKGWFCTDCHLLVMTICTNDYFYWCTNH